LLIFTLNHIILYTVCHRMTVIRPYWIPYRTVGDELVKGYGTVLTVNQPYVTVYGKVAAPVESSPTSLVLLERGACGNQTQSYGL